MTDEQQPQAKTERIAIMLQLDLRPDNPLGPGWYIDAVSNVQRYWDQPVAITPVQAYAIAEVFRGILGQTESLIPDYHPIDIVEGGNQLMQDSIDQQLQDAEADLARLQQVRQRVGMLRERKSQFKQSQTVGSVADALTHLPPGEVQLHSDGKQNQS